MTTDDLARLWQTEGDDRDDGAVVDGLEPALPLSAVDVLVGVAAARRRRSWWSVLGGFVVLTLTIAWYAAAMKTGLLEAPRFMIVSAHALLGSAVAAALFTVITKRLRTRALLASAAIDDVVSRHFAPLRSRLQRAQQGTALTLLVAAHLAVLSLVMVTFGGGIDFVVVAWAVVAVLGVTIWQLETTLAPLQQLLADTADTADTDGSGLRRGPPALSANAMQIGAPPIEMKSALPRTSTPSSSPVVLGAVPGSSAAQISSRHFDAPALHAGVLTDSERRAWRTVVGLVVVAVVPMLIDALAVLGLQWGPQPTVSDYGLTVDVPLLHRVLPYLPIAIALIASLLTPLAFMMSRDVVDRRFAGRSLWLVLMPLLGVPAVLSALGLSLGDDLNAHLWGYSLSSSAVSGVVDGTCIEECLTFFTVTVIASVGRLLRFVAVVVVAMGLRRLVGRGLLRSAVGALLVAQVLGWLGTALLPVPDAWRGLVDVVVGVGLVLLAVLSQPAFERSTMQP